MKVAGHVFLMPAAIFSLASMPVYAATMDRRIESTAKQSYVFRSYLQSDDIAIKSVDGVVSLKGTVSDETHKLLAQETVAGLPGVKSVNNWLEAGGRLPAKSDPLIGARVKALLMLHLEPGAITEIRALDGVVTLRGVAATQAKKEITGEYVKGVEGVKEVINELAVANIPRKTLAAVANERVDDASITAEVKILLLYYRSFSALKISVATKNGFVRLTGLASGAEEKEIITKFVNNVKGVRGVENSMIIK